ncbi:transcriptional regulator with XRE-family HTH domain [Pelomonas aquatica]|uniref:Transcriptional regulator with XRE-family HTH domain n=1 Tax=Pelomonas aquatica TaxID=431058 RepID=A0ABU1Z789_9BURK|nr:helix-turn-helix transcriptional regulator [Pelomonas aquatica]MDR7295845.1 transcriptional regulator with XRE-family HTH domain [Pelomonas aquatica]
MTTPPEKPATKRQASIDGLPVFARRFVQARERAGMTPEQVAVAAEIEDAASVRMSQYQRGVHTPRFSIAQNLAKALDVPVEYFYSPDDQTAELLLLWHALSEAERGQLLKSLEALL